MQVVRTIFWVLLAVVLVLFAVNNWVPVEVRIWEGLLLESKLAALVIAAFLAGLVPTWILYRATRWRLGRRIATLESSLAAQRPQPPLATSTQLENGPS
jgi:uncharacterized membrane protein